MTTFQDKKLNCVDCKAEFVFSASEQQFYAEKGFQNEPKRCEECRKNRKAQSRGGGGGGRGRSFGGGGGGGGARPKFPATCTRCGANFDAPFEPKPDRPILCRDCFRK